MRVKIGIFILSLFLGSTIYAMESFTIPDTLDETHYTDLNKFQDDLLTSTSKNLVINGDGFGGEIGILGQLVNTYRILHSNGKKVFEVVHFAAASAHAYLTCYDDQTFLDDKAFLYFHGMGVINEKNGKIISDVPVTDYDNSVDITDHLIFQDALYQCYKKGILDQQDIIDIEINNKAVAIIRINDTIYKKTIEDK